MYQFCKDYAFLISVGVGGGLLLASSFVDNPVWLSLFLDTSSELQANIFRYIKSALIFQRYLKFKYVN